MKRKEIALIRETRQGVFVRKILETIAPYMSLRSTDRVAIKINLSGSKEIYANTHYETVESLIDFLKNQFATTKISVIEGSDGAYFSGKNTWDIFYKFKYKEVELHGAELVNLDDLPHDEAMTVDTIGGQREVHFARFETDYLISVVPPKTHNILPVSAVIPNLIGFVKPEERVLMFGASTQEMRRINLFQSEAYFQLVQHTNRNFVELLKRIRPSLALVDGLYGMEGRGPIKGSPVFHGFSVASEDAVLVDALTTHVMGFNIDDLPYLDLAYREGLGNCQWQNIIGVDPQQVRFPYRPHPLFLRQKKRRDASRNAQGGRSPQYRRDQPFHEREYPKKD